MLEMKYLKEIGVKLLKEVGKKVIILLNLKRIIHTGIQRLDLVLLRDLMTYIMNITQDIQDEIQELLISETLLSDLDLDSIAVTKSPSFVDYTVFFY